MPLNSPIQELSGSDFSPSTYVDLLQSRARRQASSLAYTFLQDGETETDRITFADLDLRARSIAAVLRKQVAPGSRVLLLFPPGLDYIAAFFGCMYAGAIAVPAYPPRNTRTLRGLSRLKAIAEDCEPAAALLDPHTKAAAPQIVTHIRCLKNIAWITPLECSPDSADLWRPPSLKPSTPAFLQYTSGSTGSPRGVIVTHENLLHDQALMARAFAHDENTVIVGWLPMFHDMGLVGNVLHPVYLGIHCVLMPPLAFLEKPVRWLRAISRYKATTSGGPNFAYDYCVNKIEAEERALLDLSSWKLAFNGAEPVRPQTLEYFAKTFQSCGFRREAFYPCYGLAEATLMVSGGVKNNPPTVRRFLRDALELGMAVPHEDLGLSGTELAGCGRALPGQHLLIVDAKTGRPCPDGQVGEIWISGPIVGAGYWNNPEATAAIFEAEVPEFPEERFLRTGDLAFQHNGELFIAGRLKDQIILRGRNYHPHDLEFVAELSHPDLRPGCSAAFSMTIDSQEQVVMVLEVNRLQRNNSAEDVAAAVRQAIAEEFEIQVHTVVLIRKATIPKTSSGKIQRHACKSKFLNDSLQIEWRSTLAGASAGNDEAKEASSDLDAFLGLSLPERHKAILDCLRPEVAEIFGIPVAALDPARPLGSFGMDSLKAAEIHHRIEADLGVRIELAELLEFPSLEELATLIITRLGKQQQDQASLPAGTGSAGNHPLSYGQRALYFLSLLNPASSAYHISRAVHVLEDLDVPALKKALGHLSERHSALRTTFDQDSGEPVQIVHNMLQPDWIEEDLSSRSEEKILSRLQTERDRPFDLRQGPLMRVAVFQTAAGSVLMVTLHHMIADLWSLTIICRELALLYKAAKSGVPAELPALPLSYADFIRWQREMLDGEEGKKLSRYWKAQLQEGSPALALPADHPRPTLQTYRGASVSFRINAPVAAAIKQLCAGEKAGLYAGMVSLFQAFLYRYTGQDGLFTGSPFFGRDKTGFAGTVGYFVNPLPLRAPLSGNATFREWLDGARRTILHAISHAEYPFPLMVEQAGITRDPGRSPIFQSMIVMEQLPAGLEHLAPVVMNQGGEVVDIGGLRVRPLEVPATAAQFDLSLFLAEQAEGSLACAFEYNTDLFEQDTVARMVRHFQCLTASLLQAPDQAIASAALLTKAEQEQVTIGWNATARAYPAGLFLHELIEEQARKTPDRVAVELGDEHLTYSELDHLANGLALCLRDHGLHADQVAGLHMDRSLEMVVSLLAILKAGGAYLPLDPGYPAERLAYMAKDSGICVLLTGGSAANAPEVEGVTALAVEEKIAELRGKRFGPPPRFTDNGSLAYVIYTSGSTGKPKGVMAPHSGIVNRLLWMDETYQLRSSDKVLHKTPLSFDVSVWELFWPLIAGARLVLAPPDHHKDPARLAHLIQRHGITVMHFVPSMLRVFLEAQGVEQACGSLRLVVCSGEALTAELQKRFFQRISASLENLYGPTEASVDVTYWKCGKEDSGNAVPIGRPIANTQIYILDSSLQPAPVGVPGQLFIAGDGLARGYRGQPRLTAASFLPNPFALSPGARMYRSGDLARFRQDGAIEFLGRLDDQIKIHGNRVELGELESALAQHPAVKEAAAAAVENQLVGYLVLRPGEKRDISDLRNFLAQRLPSFMVPTIWATLDHLPINKNGKLDRKLLPVPDRSQRECRTAYAPPQTPEQELLAEVWAEVLKLDRVGIRDNFFESGGDSILSIRVISLAQKRGLAITLDQLYECQTIEALCKRLNVRGTARSMERPRPFAGMAAEERSLLPAGLEDAYPMSVLQQGLLFHSERGIDYEIYVTTLRLRARFDGAHLQNALSRVISRHPILRTTFDASRFTAPMQFVHPSAPAEIHTHDLRGLPVESREAAFSAWIQAEKKNKFDWARCPLIRINVHLLADETFQITLSDPLLDGWSVASLLTELLNTYRLLMQGVELSPPLPLASSYADFVALERNALASAECQKYWHDLLSGWSLRRLPRGPIHDIQSEEMIRRVQVVVPESAGSALRNIARESGISLKSVFLAAQIKVLGILTSSSDVVTGLISNGRPVEEDGDKIIGTHLNALCLRVQLSSCSWRELAKKAFEAERNMLPYRWYPIAEVQRQRGRQPLFEAVLNFTHFHVYRHIQELTGIHIENGYASEQTYYPLTTQCHVNHLSGEMLVALDYTREFSSAQVENIAGYFLSVLTAMADAPDRSHLEFSPLSPAEREQLLVEWNNTGRQFPEIGSLVERVEAHAAANPEALAVVCEDKRLSYAELNARANQLAHYLKKHGVGPERIVAICVDRSMEMVVGVLGILKAGGAYVPIDPAYPEERIAAIAGIVQAEVFLTQERHAKRLAPEIQNVICLDAGWRDIATCAESNPRVAIDAGNLAYVIFTSGTTGIPKGVSIPHRGLLNLVNWHIETYRLGSRDRMSQLAGFGFDASVWEIWPVLASGASLYVADEMTRLSPDKLQTWLMENKINISFVPTPIFEAMDGLSWPSETSLRAVLVGGDKLRHYPRQAFPFALVNHYGPTENTVVATYCEVPHAPERDDAPAIGRPMANTQAYILDDDLQPVPRGIPGQLYLGGSSLARGYFSSPGLTAEKFMPDCFSREPGARLYRTGDMVCYRSDGSIEFLGRMDSQVKIRGVRIEIGELEALLAQHPEVREVAVLALRDDRGDAVLAAYASPRGKALRPEHLRDFLRKKLPEFMVPSSVTLMESMPLTPNGKIDRNALPAPEPPAASDMREWVPPRNEIERCIAEVWEGVLQRRPIGIGQNFFNLGGHSLLATQVISRLRQALNLDISMTMLFESPTVDGLAEKIHELQLMQANEAEIAALLDHIEKLSQEEVRARLRVRQPEQSQAAGGY